MISGSILYTVLLVMTVITLVTTALYIWWSSRVPGAKMVSLLILVGTAWILAYMVELSSTSMSAKIFWDKVQFSAMAMVPSLWLIYVFQFTGLENLLTRRTIGFLSIVSGVILLLVFTNETHKLLWSGLELVSRQSVLSLEKTYSTGYWIFLAYSYTLILYGSFLLIQISVRSRHLYRQQTRMLLVAVILPLLGCTIYVIGTVSSVLTNSLLLPIGVTALVTGWGLARLRLADIIPVAWESVVKSISDSVIVLDRKNCVLNLNPAAQALIDRPASDLIGHSIEEVWPGSHTILDHIWDENEAAKEMVIDVGKPPQTYDMRISPLTDWRGRIVSQVVVLRDITERKRAEDLLHESEEKFRTIFEHASDEIVYLDKTGKIIDINKKSKGIFGYKGEDLIGKNFSELDFLGEENIHQMMELFREAMRGNPVPMDLVELELNTKNGDKIFAEVSTRFIWRNGEIEGILSILRDVTERKKADEKIKASLKEKEVLLREIHHRVKNNLQVISSLLSLQSAYINDSQLKEMLKEIKNRIRSMALIHEKLYQSEALAETNFEEYIRSLAHGLVRSYAISTGAVTLTVDVGDVSLSINTAIPCGLIINELVSNSLKHAFPDGKGEIRIALYPVNDSIELDISDNGVGIPEDIDFKTTETLGLRLVTILVEDQLDGEITLIRNKGTEFRIRFGNESAK